MAGDDVRRIRVVHCDGGDPRDDAQAEQGGSLTKGAWLASLAAATILFVACGGGGESPDRAPGLVRLHKIATLDQPVAMAVRSNDSTLYVAQRTGRVMAIQDGGIRSVLDVSDRVSLGGEQGLLGLAFPPAGDELYVYYTDVKGNVEIDGYAFRDGRADPATRRRVLYVLHQPYSNHNGGQIAFGPDGYLYAGIGDGGGGGDIENNAQSLDTLLGKILRIDPRAHDTAAYVVPPDNPFVGTTGALEEIWDYGLRNPWRFSFDRATGDLWIGDVGQSAWEEVDRLPADSAGGANLGWNRMEGAHPYGDATPPANAVPPVYEYAHSDGRCVITGGYVYRGDAIPDLQGAYLFADFCTGEIDTLRLEGDEARVAPLGPTLDALSSFGEDGSGELYAMSLDGGLYEFTPGSD